MDSSGSMTLPVKGGTRLKKNYAGEHFKDYWHGVWNPAMGCIHWSMRKRLVWETAHVKW